MRLVRQSFLIIAAGILMITISIVWANTFSLSAIQYSLGLFGLAMVFWGTARCFFPLARQKRVRAANIILLVAAGIVLSGLTLKNYHPDLSYFIVLAGAFLLAFGYFPLLSKNRIEKWQQYSRKKWHTYTLAYADLLSLSATVLGFLFKAMNWPGANLLLLSGFSLLALTMIGWNKLFSGEVILRKQAEEKIARSYAELESQAKIIEEKNTEILASVTYAKRIQTALITSEAVFTRHLSDHFIFYKPKDIVAGDFYWGAPTGEGFTYITADCTGHGVPGAFMSLLNISKLNEHVIGQRLYAPDLILNKVRADIITILNPEGGNEQAQDGMDCVLIHLNPEKKFLSYAAANNPFYLVRNGALIVCEADKMPVGKFECELPFTLRELTLQTGDMLYTFTDGFADQFGGERGKKFKYKQLESLFLSIAEQPAEIQKEKLKSTFDLWKGALEQVDDVCIIGVRIP